MQKFSPKITILLILLYLLLLFLHFVITAGSNLVHNARQENAANSSTYAPWLTRFKNPRFIGCWRRPWICNQEDFPRIRRRCCRNRCVDVTSDVNNCGLCGIRCPFTWQCCRGICINTNINPFHCGRCDHRCPFPSFCFYGMCGYAQPLPPFPFPFPPKPFPPRPPFPPKPFPPKGGGRRCPPPPLVA